MLLTSALIEILIAIEVGRLVLRADVVAYNVLRGHPPVRCIARPDAFRCARIILMLTSGTAALLEDESIDR